MKVLLKNIAFGLVVAVLVITPTTSAFANNFVGGGWVNISFGVYGYLSGGNQQRVRIERHSPARLNSITSLLQDNSEEVLNNLPADIFAGQVAITPRLGGAVAPIITVGGEEQNNFYNYLIVVRSILLNTGTLNDYITRPIVSSDVPPSYIPVNIEIDPSFSFNADIGYTFYKYARLGVIFSYKQLKGRGYESATIYRDPADLVYEEFFGISSKIFLDGSKISGGLIVGAQIGDLENIMAYLDYGIMFSKTTLRYGIASHPTLILSTTAQAPLSENATLNLAPDSTDKSIDHLIRLGTDFKIPHLPLRLGASAGIELTESGETWLFGATIGVRF